MSIELFDYIMTVRLCLDHMEHDGDLDELTKEVIQLTEEFRKDVVMNAETV